MTQAESDRSVTDWMWIPISDKNMQQQSSLEPEDIRKHQESVRKTSGKHQKTSENIRKHQENIQKKHLETFPSADWGKCSKKKTRRCLLVPLTSLILMVSGLPTAGPRAGLGWKRNAMLMHITASTPTESGGRRFALTAAFRLQFNGQAAGVTWGSDWAACGLVWSFTTCGSDFWRR